MVSHSSQPNNPWFGVSMALIGVIVGFGIATGTNSSLPAALEKPTVKEADPAPAPTPRPQPEAKDVKKVDKKRDHIKGDKNALISVIEYSDYECPFCVRHHPTLEKLLEENDDVNWVYRHFPLSFHPNAQVTAEASECVAELAGNDAFWEFTQIVFDKGAKKASLADYAEEVGVERAAFESCLESGKYTQYVKDDMAGGSAGGVSGTPGNIVINNKTGKTRLVSGAQPLSAFQEAVDALK